MTMTLVGKYVYLNKVLLDKKFDWKYSIKNENELMGHQILFKVS